ncbi:hypothetical protein BE08_29045, partial [Sorangium cellulosum]
MGEDPVVFCADRRREDVAEPASGRPMDRPCRGPGVIEGVAADLVAFGRERAELCDRQVAGTVESTAVHEER